ncbi:hypothetical protein [Streptomyces sp. NPDC087859]|uniref:hypothetical protein n=1 Tax=Streptomyces sp. NPDC087859 TaxID=3365812 RepID=UPI003810FB8F
MSIVVAVLLGCTVLAAAVAARIGFRTALSDGAPHALAWGVAGAAIIATFGDVCIAAAALDLADGATSGPRVALTAVTVFVAGVAAYIAYDVTGPRVSPAGGAPTPGSSKAKRLASAAGAFSGTFLILALVLPLLRLS